MNIIQIGTGKANDHLTNIINKKFISVKQHPSVLILVEPLYIYNEYIWNCYKKLNNFYIDNIGISIDKNVIEYSTSYMDKANNSINVKVPALTINSLFDKYNLTYIDILHIDVDDKNIRDNIIKSIDFNTYTITEIYFRKLDEIIDISTYLNNIKYEIFENEYYINCLKLKR